MNPKRRVASCAVPMAAGFLGVLLCVEEAAAADCSTLSHPVYVAGSSAVKPFISKVAAELAGLPTPISLVYQSQGSCAGVNYMAGSSPGTITGTGIIWDASGAEVVGGCTLGLTGNAVDIGVSDVYAKSCGLTMPAGIGDFYGPIQAMVFAVPVASTKSAISAEAAYLLFGFGAAGAVGSWSDMTQIMARSATSGTQQMLAAAIEVPAGKWFGKSNSGSGDVVNGLVASATPDAALGILATDIVDKNRAKVRSLAYQHYGQSCGYTPDSDATTSYDKKNVRDGHYAVWGPLHMFVRVDAQGVATSPDAKKVVDYLSLAETPTGFDLIQLEAKSGVVPDCAMRVRRGDEDMSPMISYMPKKSCECKFVYEATGTAPANCKTCTTSAECPATAPACNYGFCEVQ